jgi:hypothetical protein
MPQALVEIGGFPVHWVIGDEPDVEDLQLRALLREIPRICDDTSRCPEIRKLLERNFALGRAGRLPKRYRSSPGRPQKCEPLVQILRVEIAAGRTTYAALKAQGPAKLAKRFSVSLRTMNRVLHELSIVAK